MAREACLRIRVRGRTMQMSDGEDSARTRPVRFAGIDDRRIMVTGCAGTGVYDTYREFTSHGIVWSATLKVIDGSRMAVDALFTGAAWRFAVGIDGDCAVFPGWPVRHLASVPGDGSLYPGTVLEVTAPEGARLANPQPRPTWWPA
jgi:hypothetical protein